MELLDQTCGEQGISLISHVSTCVESAKYGETCLARAGMTRSAVLAESAYEEGCTRARQNPAKLNALAG